MSTLTPAQRLQFIERARAKKAQPDNKVEVLSQLEVGKGERKKRKGESSRVSISVKVPSLSAPVDDQVADAEGETHVKSPAKKRSKTLIRKNKKVTETLALEKELQETDDVVAEASPIVEENVAAGATQTGGRSPWDAMFNPELFLERMVDMAGNSSRFNTTPTNELLRMALGHELKGLLLNYALAALQRAEVSTAKEKEALVEKT
jgi:uncharacterized protein (DUF736 family)